MNARPPQKRASLEGPQPLLRETPPGQPYPVQALGPLLPVVEAVQGTTLAPVAIPAQSALAVASLAVQGFADVASLSGRRSPLSLFGLTIAQSGERKSTCDALLMAPLRAHEKEQASAQREDHFSWQNKLALWKAERERILVEMRKAKGEKRVAAQADLRALGPEPTAPASAERTVTEPTFEGLTRKFAEGHPSLGLLSDEGGQFLGGYAMNSDNRQKTLAAFNDLWQGNPIRRTRAGDGSLTLHGRRLAMSLMVQPGVARAFMADPQTSDTGFLPRFLVTEPQSTIGTRLQALTRRDDAALEAYGARLTEILSAPLPMDPETRELTPRLLPLSQAARDLLSTFSDQVERRQASGGDLAAVKGFASKAAEQAARIAGVLTLWQDLNAAAVGADIMAKAIELAEFYLGEAVRLATAAIISAETSQAEELRVWILERWPAQARQLGQNSATITPADALRYGPNALRELKLIKKLLVALVEAGWVLELRNTVIDGAKRKLAYRIVRS